MQQFGAVPALILTSTQRKQLRGLAHSLNPAVQVGSSGITEPLIQAVDQALLDHELIKVQMRRPPDKKLMAQRLADATNAGLCGLVGHTVTLYRPHPDQPRITLDA